MSKSKLIFMAVLMIVASILIVFLSEHGVEKSIQQFSGFFAGILFAAGFFLFFNQISKKKV
ncbi:MAG: hypothetical protein JZU47_22680 [Prolixibacteraceae bacterium]|nr:hypothetical protein [Prolixibacteraceae bacterium]